MKERKQASNFLRRNLIGNQFYLIGKWSFFTFLLFIGGLISIDLITCYAVKDKIYTDIDKLPNYHSAIILGTAKYYSKGVPNLYYKYRIDTALALTQKRKINHLLVSGDNKTPYYNEPKMMTEDLNKQGIPLSLIQQDFAGYRTLDSIIRADKVFHLSPFIIITQKFHCERALFIAKTQNIEAVCLVAKYPDGHFQVRIREYFARLGMIWDYIIGNQPTTLLKIAPK